MNDLLVAAFNMASSLSVQGEKNIHDSIIHSNVNTAECQRPSPLLAMWPRQKLSFAHEILHLERSLLSWPHHGCHGHCFLCVCTQPCVLDCHRLPATLPLRSSRVLNGSLHRNPSLCPLNLLPLRQIFEPDQSEWVQPFLAIDFPCSTFCKSQALE